MADQEPKSKTFIGASGVTTGALRKRVWRSLTPAVAHDCGLSLTEAQRFLELRSTPNPETLTLLAHRLGML
jgi:hypothetical protein